MIPADTLVGRPDRASYSGTVMKGTFHTALNQGAHIACHLISIVVLSRLLTPSDFGIVAMATPVVVLLGMFKELGLLQATIQKKDLTYGQVNALFWINIAISVALAALLCATAPLVAGFYGEPQVASILMALSVPMVLTGLGAQHYALMNRNLEFGKLAISGSAQALLTLVVAISWALVAPSPWALVAGGIAGAFAGTVLVWLWEPWRPGRPASAPGVGELLGFGAGITGFKLATFFSRNLDNILIGRMWGSNSLGLYDRAYKLLMMPLSQIAHPLSRVMIPVLSRMTDEPARYARAFFRVFGIMQLAILPGVAALTALAGTAVPFLLGDAWAAAVPIFMALGIAGLIQPLSNPTGWLFISQGRTGEYAWWGLGSAIVTCVAVAIGVTYGVYEVAVAFAISVVLKAPVLWFITFRRGPIALGTALRNIAPPVIGGFGAFAVVSLVTLPDPAVLRLALGGVLAYATFVLLILPWKAGRAVIGEVLNLAASAIELSTRRLRVRPAP